MSAAPKPGAFSRSRWKCPECGSHRVHIRLPVWFTESVEHGLEQVNIDDDADPDGWYCECCFECEAGAPLETNEGELPPKEVDDTRTVRDWYGFSQVRATADAPWQFHVCGFSGPPHADGSDSLCRLLRSDGSSESGIPIDSEGSITVRGRQFSRLFWNH